MPWPCLHFAMRGLGLNLRSSLRSPGTWPKPNTVIGFGMGPSLVHPASKRPASRGAGGRISMPSLQPVAPWRHVFVHRHLQHED